MIFDKKGIFIFTAALALSLAAVGVGSGTRNAAHEARAAVETVSDYPLESHTYRMLYRSSDLAVGDKFLIAMQDADGVFRALNVDYEPKFLSSNSFTVTRDYADKVFAIDEFAAGANPAIFTLDNASAVKPGNKFGAYAFKIEDGTFNRWLYGSGIEPLRLLMAATPASFYISWNGTVDARFYAERGAKGLANDEWIYRGGKITAISQDEGETYMPVDYDNDNCLDENGNNCHLDNDGYCVSGRVADYDYGDGAYDIYFFKIEDGIVDPPQREAEQFSDFPLASHTYRKIYSLSDITFGDKFIFATQGADGAFRALSNNSGLKFLSADSFTVECNYRNEVFAVEEFASGANPTIWTLDHADPDKPGIKFGPYAYMAWRVSPGSYDQQSWLMGNGHGNPWMAGRGVPASLSIDSATGAVTTRFYQETWAGRDTDGNDIWAYLGGTIRVISNDDGLTYVPVDYNNEVLNEDGEPEPTGAEAYEYTTTYDLYIFKVEKGIVSQPKIPHVTYTPMVDAIGTDLNVYDDPEPKHSMTPYYGGWNGNFYVNGNDSSIAQGEHGDFSFSLNEPYTILGFSFSAKVGTGASNRGYYDFYDDPGEGYQSGQGNLTDIFSVGPAASDGYSNFVVPLPGPVSEPGGRKTRLQINVTEGELFVESFTVWYTTAYSEFSNSVDVTSNLSFNYLMDGDDIVSISNISLKFRCDIPNSTLANISNTTGFGATVTAEGSDHSMNFVAGTDKISTSETGKYFTFSINNVPSAALKTELTITPYINADIGGETKTIYLPEKTMSIKRLVEAYTGEYASLLTELQAALIGQFATYFADELAD